MVKEFTYRDTTRQFSSRYHFTGDAPANPTKWETFSDAVVTAEEAIYQAVAAGGCKIVATVGYAGGSEIPVYNKSYNLDGSGGFSAWSPLPGDCAAVIRYSTSDRSSKNHPIYCFNYYHSVSAVAGAGNQDELHAQQKSHMLTYAADWLAGFSDGTVTHVRSRPNENACTGETVLPLVSHRDLPR